MTDPDAAQSGLRNPGRAATGLAAACLVFEALALLMGIVPMRMILDDATVAITVLVVLAAVCVVLAGMTKRSWIWKAGAVVQVALVACWPLHWAIGAAGLVFAATWAYCWNVKSILGKPPERS